MMGQVGTDTTRESRWKLLSQRTLRRALALAAAILFIVSAHTPIAIHADYPHDDGLYMALGQHLAAGEWLGAYSQFTLMKGPGYPLFLAVNSWLGLPVGLSHALFQCGAIGFFFWAFTRITDMPNLALWGFVFTLWAPVDYFDRITRDAIYPGEMLLVLGTLYYALLARLPKRNRIAWAALSGLSTGWLVLTREEGVWIVPGIAILVFYAVWISRRRHTIGRDALVPLIAMILAFTSSQVTFSALNWIEYGTVTGVETNSAPFKNALGALQSVEVGQRIPYVPVSRKARLAIYAESPSFLALRDYFDPAGGTTPWQFGCQFYPATCGDIAGGWFLWALRDAVAKQGFYTSPETAADFYRKLATEVDQACDDHRLRCSATLPAPLPHISYDQWWNLPASLNSGVRQVTYAQSPDISPEASSGNPTDIASDVAFLGHPGTTSIAQSANTFHNIYRIVGWYRSPSNDWVTGHVEQPDGHAVAIPIPRIDSPDLVTGFKDPNATHQRFDLEFACGASCTVGFTGDNGASILVNLTKLVGQQVHYSVGSATLNIDILSEHGDGGAEPDIRLRAVTAIRHIDIRLYSAVVPWLAVSALFAMLLTLVLAIYKRRLEITGVVAAAVWSLLASRLVLLGIVDISSFPGMITQYLSSANILTCLAVVLSFGALIKSIETLRVPVSLPQKSRVL